MVNKAKFLDKDGLAHFWDNVKTKIYPVGSIYMSVSNTSPASLFGGTWEQIKGKFLLAEDGGTYKAGTEGGEATHKLTGNEMPSHKHDVDLYAAFAPSASNNYGLATTKEDTAQGKPLGAWSGANGIFATNTRDAIEQHIFNTGGDQPHNNMPPYLAVYVWKRMA